MCEGAAEHAFARWLERYGSGRFVEHPFRVIDMNGRPGVFDFLTDDVSRRSRGQASGSASWHQTTVWEVKDASALWKTKSAANQRERLYRQIERCQSLAEVGKSHFQLCIAELPGWPLETPDGWAERSGCDILFLRTPLTEYLHFLTSYTVLLAGRNDRIMNDLLLIGRTGPFTIDAAAAALNQPVGRVASHVYHAADWRILDMVTPGVPSLDSDFVVSPDANLHLQSLRAGHGGGRRS